MSVIDGLDVNISDLKSHPEIVFYFKTHYECEKRHKEIIEKSRDRIINLRERAKTLEVNFPKISMFVKLFKTWTDDELYALILRATQNDESHIKFKKFIYECFGTLRDIAKQKSLVKIQNGKAKREASRRVKAAGFKIGIISYAYKQMKAKTKFYIDNNLNVKDPKLEKYAFLDSFVNAFTMKNIDDYHKELEKPKTVPIERMIAGGLSSLTSDVINFIADQAILVHKRLAKDRQQLEQDIYTIFGATPELVKKNDEAKLKALNA